VSSGSGKHGHLDSLKAIVELCIFGPSLFGYTGCSCSQKFRYSNAAKPDSVTQHKRERGLRIRPGRWQF
jgi:hypothetical protein